MTTNALAGAGKCLGGAAPPLRSLHRRSQAKLQRPLPWSHVEESARARGARRGASRGFREGRRSTKIFFSIWYGGLAVGQRRVVVPPRAERRGRGDDRGCARGRREMPRGCRAAAMLPPPLLAGKALASTPVAVVVTRRREGEGKGGSPRCLSWVSGRGEVDRDFFFNWLWGATGEICKVRERGENVG